MTSTADKVAALVSVAQSQVGVPYVYGGDGPAGFDCSGLVQWTAAKLGILLPRTAAAQYAATQRITTTGPAPAGALVFFASNGTDIDHVGISIGGGYMIDAPHTGANVRVESYTSWNDFVGATDPFVTTGGGVSTLDATTAGGVSNAGLTTESASWITGAEQTLTRVSLTVLGLAIGGAIVAAGLFRAVQKGS